MEWNETNDKFMKLNIVKWALWPSSINFIHLISLFFENGQWNWRWIEIEEQWAQANSPAINQSKDDWIDVLLFVRRARRVGCGGGVLLLWVMGGAPANAPQIKDKPPQAPHTHSLCSSWNETCWMEWIEQMKRWDWRNKVKWSEWNEGRDELLNWFNGINESSSPATSFIEWTKWSPHQAPNARGKLKWNPTEPRSWSERSGWNERVGLLFCGGLWAAEQPMAPPKGDKPNHNPSFSFVLFAIVSLRQLGGLPCGAEATNQLIISSHQSTTQRQKVVFCWIDWEWNWWLLNWWAGAVGDIITVLL